MTVSVSPAVRRPPHSEEAERGVLGSALLDAERVLDLCVVSHIITESFHLHRHRVIYGVLCEMHEDRRPVDLLTATERLEAKGVLDQAGGAAFLEELILATPTAAHAEYYIGIVRHKHLLRAMIDSSVKAIEMCYEEKLGADATLGHVEEMFFTLGQDGQGVAVPWAPVISDVVHDVNLIADGKKQWAGVYTGFADIDHLLSGLQPADMVVLAARPSMGKTALALNIAEHVVTGTGTDASPQPVAMFSLEMSAQALVTRMLCAKARVRSDVLRRGHFLSGADHKALLQAAASLKGTQLLIDDSGGLSVQQLRSRARRLKHRHNIQLLIVDYLQLLKDPKHAEHGPQWETANISNALKAMAKELKIPVLVLSQLNRSPEKRESRRPRLSDLRESGAIEQDADVVLLLHRPCKHKEDPEFLDDALALVEIAKHRNGPTGLARLNFLEELTRFENRIEERRAGEMPGGEADD
ncbi:MAG: replicative DNA helicase [Kiritimatiellae bacterium]|nr:replicative DNA helicase [Kiritimatiellia bacterium]